MGYLLNGKYYKGDAPGDLKRPRRQPGLKRYEMDREIETFRKDIIQPYLPNGQPNPAYIDAYPDDAQRKGMVNKDERNY